MAPPHVINWLRQATANYVYQDQTIGAISSALDQYPSLKIKTDQYTFDDGRTLLLLCLHGTLPITYSSARYNVPVAVWVPLDFARSPPMVYVVPTSGMLVRKGKGVELDGRVSETEWEYLKGWRRKWEAHSMLPLLQSLVDAFSLYPPVYAKPAQAQPTGSPSPTPVRVQSSPSTSNSQPQSPMRPNYGHQGQEHLPQYSHPSTSSNGQPPPPPPPPPPPAPPIPTGFPPHNHARQGSLGPAAVQTGMPRSDSQGSSGHPNGTTQRSQTYSPGYNPPLSIQGQYNQYSGPQGSPQAQHQYYQQPPPLPQHPQVGAQSPQPLAMHPAYQQGPPQHYQPQRSSTMPGHSYQQPPHPQSPLRPPAHPATARPVSQPPAPVARQPIPDLLADDDPPLPLTRSSIQPSGPAPPPPPPNPETLLLHSTLHATLSAQLSSTLAELETRKAQLGQITGDLTSAGPAIEDEMARLRAVRDVCRGVCDRLGGVVKQGQERLEWLEARGEVSVDEVVCSTTIVYNQLIDLVAEDAAISDTLYQLNRALTAERIDLERFLKMTRILARDQFRCRALVEKILQG